VGSVSLCWNDVVAAAAPNRARLERREALLAERISSATLQIVQLERAVRPFGSPLAGEPDGAAERRARRALANDELLSTPPDLARRLDEQSVAVWRVGAGNDWGVFTRFDTIWLAPGESCDLGYQNLLPAKGPGQSSLSIGELSLSSAPSSPRMLDVLGLVEHASGRSIPRHEDYDA
jgi:hypothetical protein